MSPLESVPSSVLAPEASVSESTSSVVSWLPLVSLVLSLGALWFVCCWHLSAECAYNEQYSYGWFVPFFALYLFWLRCEDKPKQFRLSTFNFRLSAIVIAIAAVVLLPLRVFEIANPDWRPLGWIHATAAIMITLAGIFF